MGVKEKTQSLAKILNTIQAILATYSIALVILKNEITSAHQRPAYFSHKFIGH